MSLPRGKFVRPLVLALLIALVSVAAAAQDRTAFACVITAQPQSQTILSGETATLSVTALAASSYQWYRGGSPTTGTPIPMAYDATYTTLPLTATETYSVRVSGPCGTADSDVATVTVICDPTITQQPASATIAPGESVTLQVTATAATAYQWYRGASGSVSDPIAGATSSTYVTGPISATTSFWVEVRNACGRVNSATATISVCALPSITAQPQSATIAAGQSALLSIGVSGAMYLQWYRGVAGDTSSPIAGATSASLDTGPLTATTKFWARATNACGSVDSATATVTVASCTQPQIATHPQSATVRYGDAATLTVVASGTALRYQWYEGPAGDLGRPVAGATSSTFKTPALTGAAQYWVLVSNECGSASSLHATLTVAPSVVVAALPDALVQVAGTGGATTALTLTNQGAASTSLTLAREGDFFAIDPATFDLAAGCSRQVVITGAPRAVGTWDGAIVATGAGAPAGLRVPVRLLSADRPPSGNPKAQPEETRVDLAAPAGQDLVNGSVAVSNVGDAALSGVVSSDVPWILISQPFVTIPAGGRATIAFVVDRRLRFDAAERVGSAIGTLSLRYLASSGGGAASAWVEDLDAGTGVSTTLVSVADTAKPATATGAPPPLAAGEVALFVASLGHVRTGAGTFVSDLFMASLSSLSNLTVYYTAAGQSLASTVRAAVPSLTSVRPIAFSDLTKNVFAHDEGLGTLQVRTDDPGALAISATVVNKSNAAGTYGSAVPVFRSDRGIRAGESMVIPGLLPSSASGRTNLTVQELTGADASVAVDLLDRDGAILTTLGGVVPAFQHVRMNDFAPAGAAAAVIRVTGGGGAVLAYATPFDLLSGDTWVVTDWPRVDGFDPAAPQIIPIAGKLEGANQNYFRSTTAIMNPSYAPASVIARFVSNAGAVVEKSVQLAPRATAVWTDMVGELFGSAGIGFVAIDPRGAPVVVTSRTFATIGDDPRTFGTGVPAVAASRGAGSIERISGFDDADAATVTARTPATFRTNLGLVETAGADATVRVTLHFRHPVSTTVTCVGSGSAEYQLAPRQFLLLPGIAAQILGAFRTSLKGNLRDLFVDIEVVSGPGKIVAFTSSVDNGTGDQVFKLQ